MSTDSSDLNAVAGLVRDVAGVYDAVAVADLRLCSAGGAAGEPDTPAPGAGERAGGVGPALVHGAEPVLPGGAARTLSEALVLAARHAPERGTTYVLADGSTDRQTYRELLDDALRLLGGMNRSGQLRPGDPVLVHHADNRSFVTTWWACVLGGFLPTAVATAHDYGGDSAAVRKLHAAWELLDRPVVMTDDGLRDRVEGLAGVWEGGHALRVLAPSRAPAGAPGVPHPADPDDPALNLLTSGSTGTPKCVHHTHRSLIARTYSATAANGFTADEVSLNWMPLDHVGGMVMFNLRDVVLRCEHVNAPTELVVRRPLTWLDLVDRFRITNTWAPNFAFSLVNRYATEIEAGAWDLSTLANICNAGEAVVPRTARRFLELLTPHALPADAMVPCWGMSETASGVTYSRMHADDPAAGTVALDPASLETDLMELPAGASGSITVTEVGAPIAGVGLRIVDGEGTVLPEGRVGRLHACGSTIMAGYLHNDGANAASFPGDGWFDTGDLGFLRHGRLFLTGRKKHMVIVNGVNYPAHEVEAVIEQVPGVRPAHSVVCAVRDEGDETDGIAVFFVPTAASSGELDRTLAGIRAGLAADLALRPRCIVPVTAEEFPRAPGGKVQRERLADGLRDGLFDNRLFPGEAGCGDDDGGRALLERSWTPVEAEPAGDQRDGTVLLYVPDPWPGGAVDGSTAVLAHAPAFRVVDDRHVEADLADPGQHERAVAHLVGGIGTPQRVVYATDAGGERIGDGLSGVAERFVATVAALAGVAPGAELTVLVADALGVGPADRPNAARATLPALVRTAVAEGAFRSARLVDTPDAAALARTPRAIPRFAAEIVGVRDGTAHASSLRRLEPAERFGVPARFLPPGGTALVTGGLGGLGRVVAEQLLVGAGARLLVVGRTPEAELTGIGRDAVLDDLRALGDVRYSAVDVADADALSAVVVDAEQAWGRGLDLVVHLAGAPVAAQWTCPSGHELRHESPEWLRSMLRPKLGGCAAVDRLLAAREDLAIVLYSSVNGYFGGTGFGAYSAANGAMDAFAHRWTAAGHAVRCIAWSMWAGPGMNDGSPLVPAARHRGLRLLDPGDGLSLLLSALHQEATVVLAGVDAGNPHVKRQLAADQFAGGGVVVAVVPDDDAEPERVRHAVGSVLAEQTVFARVVVLRQLPRDAGGAVDPVQLITAADDGVTGYEAPVGKVEELVAGVAGELLEAGRVGRDDSFFALGCDSIRATQLVERVGVELGLTIPIGALYEDPTVRGLSDVAGRRDETAGAATSRS